MLWWMSRVFATTWVVDASSTALGMGGWPVRGAIVCAGEARATLHGRALRTQGIAVVVYSRKEGTMSWGHASVRAVGCLDDEPFDREYEVYRLGPGNMGEIRRFLAGEDVLQDAAYLRRERGALFRFRNDDPVDGGFFAQSHAHNREIYELWLDLSPSERDDVVLRLEAALDDQLARLRAREPLEGTYGALSTNCTVPLQELLPGDWHLPFRWLRELEDQAALRVFHPSHHVLAGWTELPEEVERRRIPFRWRKDVSAWRGRLDRDPVLPTP